MTSLVQVRYSSLQFSLLVKSSKGPTDLQLVFNLLVTRNHLQESQNIKVISQKHSHLERTRGDLFILVNLNLIEN